MKAIVIVAIAYFLSGCLPYLVPPATGSISLSQDNKPREKTGVRAEIGVSPLQLSNRLYRRWDVHLFGLYESHRNEKTWGGGIALGPTFYPWRKHESGVAYRLTQQSVLRLTTHGYELGFRTTMERVNFFHSSFSHRGDDGLTGNTGVGYGEAAIGVFLEPRYQDHDLFGPLWGVIAGIHFRIPALLGIACCME